MKGECAAYTSRGNLTRSHFHAFLLKANNMGKLAFETNLNWCFLAFPRRISLLIFFPFVIPAFMIVYCVSLSVQWCKEAIFLATYILISIQDKLQITAQSVFILLLVL